MVAFPLLGAHFETVREYGRLFHGTTRMLCSCVCTSFCVLVFMPICPICCHFQCGHMEDSQKPIKVVLGQ